MREIEEEREIEGREDEMGRKDVEICYKKGWRRERKWRRKCRKE
jgi:hypothetical protein